MDELINFELCVYLLLPFNYLYRLHIHTHTHTHTGGGFSYTPTIILDWMHINLSVYKIHQRLLHLLCTIGPNQDINKAFILLHVTYSDYVTDQYNYAMPSLKVNHLIIISPQYNWRKLIFFKFKLKDDEIISRVWTVEKREEEKRRHLGDCTLSPLVHLFPLSLSASSYSFACGAYSKGVQGGVYSIIPTIQPQCNI